MKNDTAFLKLSHGKVNAFGSELVNVVHTALDEVENNAKSLVIYSDGIFSAGFDLVAYRQHGQAGAKALFKQGGELVLRLFQFPIPIVMAAGGHGIGLGAIILMCADVSLGVPEGKYGLTATSNGIPLPNFGLELARHRLAPHELTAAALHSKIYLGQAAADAGFLTATHPAEHLLTAATESAHSLEKLPSAHYKLTKMQLRKDAAKRMALDDIDHLLFNLP